MHGVTRDIHPIKIRPMATTMEIERNQSMVLVDNKRASPAPNGATSMLVAAAPRRAGQGAGSATQQNKQQQTVHARTSLMAN